MIIKMYVIIHASILEVNSISFKNKDFVNNIPRENSAHHY